MSSQTRRDFLTITLPAAALAACGGGAQVPSPAPTPDPPPGPPDPVPPTPDGYKALVAIFLFGGNDAYNSIVPADSALHAAYARVRQEVAIPREQLLDLGLAGDGARYGAHPALAEFQALYGRGHAAIVGDVGPLVAPLADGRIRSAGNLLPPRLFSHNDQSDQWQQTAAASLEQIGWAGRAADLLAPTLPEQALPIGVTLGGANLLQTGRNQVGFALNPGGPVQAPFHRRGTVLHELYPELLAAAHPHLFVQEYARGQLRGLDYNQRIAEALTGAPAVSVSFPDDRLGQQLAAVARMIAVRAPLGVQRQIFFVGLGGFDTHADQLPRHHDLLRSLSQGLDSFYRATELLGVAGSVTSFTVSDFGRSLSVNGDGTDHGWSSHQLIVGGAVRGGRFYGGMPELAQGSARDFTGGRFAPTTAVDQYGATLLRWFGIPASDLGAVFPNLGRFASPDLGLFG